MLHALNPIEKTICQKIVITAALLIAVLVVPLLAFHESLCRLGGPARALITLSALAAFLFILSKRIKKIVSRHVSRPLDELSKLADEVAAGNYYAHASVFSDTEVGSLAKNLNFMVEMTSKHTAALEEELAAASAENARAKAAVEKLEAEVETLRKGRLDMDRLASMDVKTPVNALINHLEAVCFEGPELREKYLARLNSLTEAVRNSYLDAFAASCGAGDDERFIINRRRTSLLAIIEKAVEYYAPIAEIKKITLSRDVQPELAAANVDGPKIAAVVNNLVSNAVKFSPAGATITLRACFEGDSLLFSISDRGGGVANDIQEKIFLNDFCVTTPGTFNESGFGAGLKICKTLIEAHGGAFWFENPGAGSVFFFKVPAARPAGRG